MSLSAPLDRLVSDAPSAIDIGHARTVSPELLEWLRGSVALIQSLAEFGDLSKARAAYLVCCLAEQFLITEPISRGECARLRDVARRFADEVLLSGGWESPDTLALIACVAATVHRGFNLGDDLRGGLAAFWLRMTLQVGDLKLLGADEFSEMLDENTSSFFSLWLEGGNSMPLPDFPYLLHQPLWSVAVPETLH